MSTENPTSARPGETDRSMTQSATSAPVDDRANVVLRIPARDLSRLKAWMTENVVAELHITGQPPIECDIEEAWSDGEA